MKIHFNFNIEHLSQYHKETYKEHVLLVFYYTCISTMDKNIRKAAILHDIRKPETFGYNKINEPCFYGHEEVSDEDIINYIEEGEDAKYIKALIVTHMTPYKCLTTKNDFKDTVIKSCKKTLKKFNIEVEVNEKFYRDLMILHHADQAGSIRIQQDREGIENKLERAYEFLKEEGIEID